MVFPKAQHYLPRFYLRRFAVPSASGRNHQVYVHDLEDNRTFRMSIKNIGQRTGFYDIDLKGGGRASLDPALQKLETQFAPALKRLLSTRDPAALSGEDRAAIAMLCVTTYMRGPAMRDTLVQIGEGTVRAIGEKPGRPLTDEEIGRIGLKPLTSDQLTYLSGEVLRRGAGQMAAMLAAMEWKLAEAPLGKSVPTSDCPLVLHNEESVPEPMGNLGLVCKGIEVYFPLSAQFCLVCFHREDFPRPARVKIVQMDRENLAFITHLLVMYATRFLISRDGNFELRPSMKRLKQRVEVL